jgi:endoglucanase
MDNSLRGVNLAGAEWAYIAGHKPVEGQDFQFVSHQDIDYLASKGVVFARLIVSWEILQPSLNAAFAPAYAAALNDRVGYAASKGMSVMLEPHGGEYALCALQEPGGRVGRSSQQRVCRLVATSRAAYQGGASVVFGLTNEPNNMSTLQWFAAAQAG